MKINEVIVVEGYHDAQRLKQLFEVDVIVTNGSALNDKTLSLIEQTSKTKGVIVFSDPDYPGEKIRKTIMKVVPDAKHAFIKKSKAISSNKKKVGVEHASDQDLLESLENVISLNETSNSLLYEDYLKLDLVGNKKNRVYLCDSLNIGYCNAKTLFKRLNMLNMKYDKLKDIMGLNDE